MIVCNLIANLHHYKDGYFMKQNNTTKQLMQLYFGKQFSKYGRILFGRWLKATDVRLLKDELLQELWDESQSEVTASTHSDWEALQKHLSVRPIQKSSVSLYLIFENVSFNQLMASLERKFNVTIHYNSQKYANEYYNVKFSPDETIEDVLNILQQLVGIQYKVNGRTVFIN